MKRLLEIKDLEVSFLTHQGQVQAVRGVDLHVNQGEILCIVGESGSGKSVTAHTVMQLIPMPPGFVKEGEILYENKNLLGCSKKEMEDLRGSEISMIFQDPMTALNPTMKVGHQIVEGIRKHKNLTKLEAKKKAVEMLALVGIPDPMNRMNQYPHEFSGGMRQRVMIAIALACEPQLLIADEPTTALDVTIQAQILDLIVALRDQLNMAIILITHDLGVVARVADRVAVMYGGKIMETAPVTKIFESPRHPYTWGLLKSIPSTEMPCKAELDPINGYPPDLLSPPQGCPFSPRCDHAMAICSMVMPNSSTFQESHRLSCWLEHDMAPEINREAILHAMVYEEERESAI